MEDLKRIVEIAVVLWFFILPTSYFLSIIISLAIYVIVSVISLFKEPSEVIVDIIANSSSHALVGISAVAVTLLFASLIHIMSK